MPVHDPNWTAIDIAARSPCAALRRQFAVVSQDIVLFDDSLLANVAYAQAPDARTGRALPCATPRCGTSCSSLPEGLNTRIGANGSTL